MTLEVRHKAIFVLSHVSVAPVRCLNARNKELGCSFCQADCPSQAITLQDGLPHLDGECCFSCGICLQSCPSGAYTAKGAVEKSLLDHSLPFDSSNRITCPQQPEAPSDPPIWKVGVCLASLSPAFYFEIALFRPYVIVLSNCVDTHLRQLAVHNIQLAQQLLQCWGLQDNLRVEESDPDTPKETFFVNACPSKEFGWDAPNNSYEKDARLPVRSRNKLFDSKKNHASTAKENAAAFARIPSRDIPLWRTRLKRLWLQIEKMKGTPLSFSWPHLSIDPAQCLACGTCMQFCPSGAIAHKLHESQFSINFQPGLCLDCGLCERSCQSQALRRGYAYIQKPFEENELITVAVCKCTSCGSPAIDNLHAVDLESLCVWCNHFEISKNILDELRVLHGHTVPRSRENKPV